MFRKNKKKNNEMFFNTESNSNFNDLLEKPLKKKIFNFYIFSLFIIFIIFIWKLYSMQIVNNENFLTKAKNNFIKSEVLFSDRGIILDRNNIELVWNENKTNREFSERKYLENIGLSHILGFLSYPKKDTSGNYFTKEYSGKAGVEKYFNEYLNGELGKKIIKIDAKRNIVSENSIIKPGLGKNLNLTIDYVLQKNLFESLNEYLEEGDYVGGAGIIMDVRTGEILSSISLPEYDSNIMTDGKEQDKIKEYLKDKRNIFLNRSFMGGYTPGSIVKPFVGLMALENNIIKFDEKIKTNGRLILPNPYTPSKPTIFSDWKNQGTVDLKKAIAWSSNVYFYILGGGLNGILNYSNKTGLGIDVMSKEYGEFGFGEKTGIEKFKEKIGLVPDREWKKKIFNKSWNIGNTYFSSIGQFGFLLTPLQAVVAVSSLANDGKILKPVISELGQKNNIKRVLKYSDKNLKNIREAMRETVLSGTTQSLNFDFVKIATKSGTAQIKNNTRVNSWVIGFWPYEEPKYAFVVLADDGPKGYNRGGASRTMTKFFLKLKEQKIEKYFK